jgi:hypothetical protein
LASFGCPSGVVYNGCTGAYGFNWKDNGASGVPPTSVQVAFNGGVDCEPSGLAATVTLNGASAGTFNVAAESGTSCTCGPPSTPSSITITGSALSSYALGGTNTVLISATTCDGITPIAGSTYANVVVTFP